MQMSRLSMKFHSPSLPPPPPPFPPSFYRVLPCLVLSLFAFRYCLDVAERNHCHFHTQKSFGTCDTLFGFKLLWLSFFPLYPPSPSQRSSCDPCQPVTLAITVSHIPLLRSVATFALAFVVNITHWQNICLN